MPQSWFRVLAAMNLVPFDHVFLWVYERLHTCVVFLSVFLMQPRSPWLKTYSELFA